MSPAEPAAPEALIAMMGMAHSKLRVARLLVTEAPRDSASRAYYAAFHALSALLASVGFSYSSHGQVIGAFNREFVKTGRISRVATEIVQRLFKDRQTGDYDFEQALSVERALEDLRDAEWLVGECERCIGGNEAT